MYSVFVHCYFKCCSLLLLTLDIFFLTSCKLLHTFLCNFFSCSFLLLLSVTRLQHVVSACRPYVCPHSRLRQFVDASGLNTLMKIFVDQKILCKVLLDLLLPTCSEQRVFCSLQICLQFKY